MLDLFQPPRIKPRPTRRVALAGVRMSDEERRQQWMAALVKARTAPRKPRARKSDAELSAAQARRREQQAAYARKRYHQRDIERFRAEARERMAKVREKRRSQ